MTPTPADDPGMRHPTVDLDLEHYQALEEDVARRRAALLAALKRRAEEPPVADG